MGVNTPSRPLSPGEVLVGIVVLLACFTLLLLSYGIVPTVLFGVLVVALWRAAVRAPRVGEPHAR
jgi:hypothetical protein